MRRRMKRMKEKEEKKKKGNGEVVTADINPMLGDKLVENEIRKYGTSSINENV